MGEIALSHKKMKPKGCGTTRALTISSRTKAEESAATEATMDLATCAGTPTAAVIDVAVGIDPDIGTTDEVLAVGKGYATQSERVYEIVRRTLRQFHMELSLPLELWWSLTNGMESCLGTTPSHRNCCGCSVQR
jgi:hypothetical protein